MVVFTDFCFLRYAWLFNISYLLSLLDTPVLPPQLLIWNKKPAYWYCSIVEVQYNCCFNTFSFIGVNGILEKVLGGAGWHLAFRWQNQIECGNHLSLKLSFCFSFFPLYRNFLNLMIASICPAYSHYLYSFRFSSAAVWYSQEN